MSIAALKVGTMTLMVTVPSATQAVKNVKEQQQLVLLVTIPSSCLITTPVLSLAQVNVTSSMVPTAETVTLLA